MNVDLNQRKKFNTGGSNPMDIDERGIWISEDPQHANDPKLSELLINFLSNQSVFDIGCGDGYYIKDLKKVCSEVGGCDGNPYTEELTDGLGYQADLSEKQNFKKYDWVLSFETGEHIPQEFENIFLDNICDTAIKGAIISWAHPGQSGGGHVNCRSTEWVIEQMYKRGFLIDYIESTKFRQNTEMFWFKSNLLVFYNINNLK